jgi:transcription antitermination protein NusB
MLRNESRFRARALQTLYALEVTGGGLAPSIDGVARLTGQYPLVIDDIEPMIERLRVRLPELDRLAQSAADNWRLERIAVVERNILRLAVFELLEGEVPAKVVIDEALWLAHRFAGDRAPSFINGVLDRVARDLGRL